MKCVVLLAMSSFAYTIFKNTKQTIYPMNIANAIPNHYKLLWNKIPDNFMEKIGMAVANKNITLEDVSNLKSDIMKGIFMFTAAGFSLEDAVILERKFGSDDFDENNDITIPMPNEIDQKYKLQWQRIPQNLRSKLVKAIKSKKLSSRDLNHCISTAKKGVSMLESIGFSNKEAVEVEADLAK